jgi:probable rRNA maturation factor
MKNFPLESQLMKIEIVRKTKKRIEKSFVEKVVKKTLAVSKKKGTDFSVSIIFADRDKIREINRKYRKINKATDILSFNYSSGYNGKKIGGQPALLRPPATMLQLRAGEALLTGELFLCPEVIEKSAKDQNVSFQKELAFVLSHGILHLLGFRHGEKMYELQDKVLYELRI